MAVHEPETICEKVAYLSRRSWEVFSSDIKYAYCLLGSMAFSLTPLAIQVYLVQWITSFVDSGYLESEEVSKKLLAKISVLSIVFLLPAVPLIGKAVDKISEQVMIPIAFFIRMVMCLIMVFCVKVPDSWLLTFVIVMLTLATAVE